MKKVIVPLALVLVLAAVLLFALLPKIHPASPAPETEPSPTAQPSPVKKGDSLSSEEEILALFARQKQSGAESFELPCEEELFRSLTADNARLLSLLQVRSGIGDAEIRFSEEDSLIRYTQVLYTEDPWADCASEEELGQAVRRFLSEGAASFRLLCSPELAESLARNGHVQNYSAAAGFPEVTVSCFPSGIVQVRDPKPFQTPWASVEDSLQFDLAIEGFALQELDEFTVVFSPALAQKLEDAEAQALLHASSMLDRFSREEKSIPGLVRYYLVSYSHEPGLVCRSESDVTRAISRMGVGGFSSFHLYLEGEKVRSVLMDTPLAYFHAAESWGGITQGNVSHADNTIYYRSIYFMEAKLSPDARSLPALEDAEALMEQKRSIGEPEITLFCSPELYEELLGAPGAFLEDPGCLDPFYALLERHGIGEAEVFTDRATGVISILALDGSVG